MHKENEKKNAEFKIRKRQENKCKFTVQRLS